MRNIFINLACAIMFVLVANESCAQILFGEEHPYMQRARVGLVDEFIKRFNGDVSHPDISLQDSTYRSSNILYLIEPPQDTANIDSLYNEAVKFVSTIITDSVKLNYSDSTWVALAKCSGSLDGKQVSFKVYLNVEHRSEDMYKWVISRVAGECFDTTPLDTTSNVMLYPDDHETKFISLGRMTDEQPFNVARFMSKGFEYDATSVFVYLVKSNRLKINYVEELEFIFTQVPGYIFSIKYFERESNKSGWLINKFSTISASEKENFLRLLNLRSSEDTINVVKQNKDTVSELSSSEDTVLNMVKKARNIYCMRLRERMRLLQDYMDYILNANNRTAAKYYQKKILPMFSSDSRAFIYNENNGITNEMPIESFFDRVLIEHKFNNYRIEKITVPAEPIMKETEDEYQFKSIIVSLTGDGSNVERSDQLLVARKVQTEDGIEWIAYFGNIYVTVE
ncbi:MAG TPA: hypothetical protein IAA88_08730 [Candidatus Avimuribaculum pullicola]|nr:hypothetical protein [Candidatus Avimuribaculum pullicola]